MRVATAEDACKLLAPYFEDEEAERVVVLHLAADRSILGLTVEAGGGLDEVELPVRAIAASALRLGTDGLIVAHNHPSGDPAPSAADGEATRRLAEVLPAMGIRLLDHLIFAAGEMRSLRALGLL